MNVYDPAMRADATVGRQLWLAGHRDLIASVANDQVIAVHLPDLLAKSLQLFVDDRGLGRLPLSVGWFSVDVPSILSKEPKSEIS